MQHGFLKPAPPAIAKAGSPTILYPPETGAIDITPLELNGKIHPGTAASEFGAYMIVGREVTVKRFLSDYGSACVYNKKGHKLVVSKWTHNKNSKALQDVQMGVGLGKTLISALENSYSGEAYVGAGTAAKAGFNTAKYIYDSLKSKKIDLDKVPDPDGTTYKQVKNFFKLIVDNMTGNRTVVMVSVLATPPRVASRYQSSEDKLTFSNIASILKGL